MKASTIILLSVALSVKDGHSQDGSAGAVNGDPCITTNRMAVALVAAGRYADAEKTLLNAAAGDADLNAQACSGLMFSDMAVLMSISGRNSQAERFAGRAVAILSNAYGPSDHTLLKPLLTLASAHIEQSRAAPARQALQKTMGVKLDGSRDDALVHAITASLLRLEGRLIEATAEGLAALRDWERAGRGDSVDAASTLNLLGVLYIQTRRFPEARKALDRALAIFDSTKETSPMDRIKVLYVSGTLHVRRGELSEAERDFSVAIAIADRESTIDPIHLRPILVSYAQVLRKNHRPAEARAVEARAAELRAGHAAVVSLSELRAGRSKK
jgi:eukaryotic-like serine/threonine-protein kinase